MTSFGFLSTYPPTQCGLATFSAALLRHLTIPGSGDSAGVVRVLDEPPRGMYPDVVSHLVNGSPGSASTAAAALNRFDVAVVQHEYGIYGGRDGQDVLRVLADLTVPAIVVLHTVLLEPSAHQRQVLEQVVDAADVTVVMSQTAVRRLGEVYLVDPDRVIVIPHGALGTRRMFPIASTTPFTLTAPANRRPTILTWGLIGPGKGIEWAIDALGSLHDLTVPPRYLIADRTRPKVLAHDGEAYSASLRARATANSVAGLVEFDASYRNPAALVDLARQADIVLLPYDSTEQVASGVLIEAIAATRPIVATGFPHAAELLADGAGVLEPGLAASMTARSKLIALMLEWSAVADRYRRAARTLVDDRMTAVV